MLNFDMLVPLHFVPVMFECNFVVASSKMLKQKLQNPLNMFVFA